MNFYEIFLFVSFAQGLLAALVGLSTLWTICWFAHVHVNQVILQACFYMLIVAGCFMAMLARCYEPHDVLHGMLVAGKVFGLMQVPVPVCLVHSSSCKLFMIFCSRWQCELQDTCIVCHVTDVFMGCCRLWCGVLQDCMSGLLDLIWWNGYITRSL